MSPRFNPRHVIYAIDDAEQQKFDAALLHACIAIDGTAKRLFPDMVGKGNVARRYKKCLRQYYWIIEPMIGSGINLHETKFSNLKLGTNTEPDIADVIFEIFRCSSAHAEEIPAEFMVIPSVEGSSQWHIGKDRLHMPDRIIWALLAVAVFAKANSIENSEGNYFLSLGEDRFLIRDWWGREDDFRPFASRANQVRVKLENLGTFPESSSLPNSDEVSYLIIRQPNASVTEPFRSRLKTAVSRSSDPALTGEDIVDVAVVDQRMAEPGSEED